MTARTNIHFQEKFFNNSFLSVQDVRNTAETLSPNASSPSRQQKATPRAGGPARRKPLSQRHTFEHPQPGADRSRSFNEPTLGSIGNQTVFPENPQKDVISIDRQPGSGLFLSRLLRCSLNLAADISTGNLDTDFVRNLDCQG
jgi:hypothetical protein